MDCFEFERDAEFLSCLTVASVASKSGRRERDDVCLSSECMGVVGVVGVVC